MDNTIPPVKREDHAVRTNAWNDIEDGMATLDKSGVTELIVGEGPGKARTTQSVTREH